MAWNVMRARNTTESHINKICAINQIFIPATLLISQLIKKKSEGLLFWASGDDAAHRFEETEWMENSSCAEN